MDVLELKAILETVVKLTELRQNECKHLCVDNFAQNCFSKLLEAYHEPSNEVNAPDSLKPGLLDGVAYSMEYVDAETVVFTRCR